MAPNVMFSFTPDWSGVTAVSVLGAFGTGDDWNPNAPFLTLTNDGKGNWSGSAYLPDGSYSYLLQVVGDDDAKNNTKRYMVDPQEPGFEQCPNQAPTADGSNAPICSELTLPATKVKLSHVKGKVTLGGSAAQGYLVQLDRDEPMLSASLANRADTKADGSYDFVVANGNYRVQVLHPTYYTLDDSQRDPTAYNALRTSASSALAVSGDVAVDAADMQYSGYAAMTPTKTATLPTSFTLQLTGSNKSRVAVYGSSNKLGKTITSAYFDSKFGSSTSVSFDGTFNQSSSPETMVATGEDYFWGVFEQRVVGSTTWTAQSMVFPIVWQ